MEMDRYDHGVPSWVDLGSPDLDGARAFYSSLFGWEAPPGPPEAGGYTVAMLRGQPVAGLGPQMNPEAPAVWMTYVNVDDAGDVLSKVGSSGGSVLMGPMDVMDVGRMGIFADPEGAVIGVWQPGTHKGAGLVNEPGTYCWSELVTRDVERAKPFYQAVFGWGAQSQPADGGMAYTEWKLGDRSVGGALPRPEEMPAEVPPHWAVYFAVSDADATVSRVQELGGTLLMGPTDIEPGRFAVLMDRGGTPFNILQLKEGLAA